MKDRRRFTRTRFDARLEVLHPRSGMLVFRTGDVSDGGLYLLNGPAELMLGDELTVRVLDMGGPAPSVRVRVVRRDAAGFGLEFVDLTP
ncbi:MAG: PilZ domain-containing protein [Gammaproteobacteria bacterium]